MPLGILAKRSRVTKRQQPGQSWRARAHSMLGASRGSAQREKFVRAGSAHEIKLRQSKGLAKTSRCACRRAPVS